MAGAQTPEQLDAIYRARAEVKLLFGRYERRLKKRAEDLVLAKMLANPDLDPEEAGREAFEQAQQESDFIIKDVVTAALPPATE